MEETLAFQKMEEIDLINNLERISSEIPNRIFKIEGYILKKNTNKKQKYLFSKVSLALPFMQFQQNQKKVLDFDFIVTNFRLYKSPFTEPEDNLSKRK